MLPFIDGRNPLTWKCKILGCRDEQLPAYFNVTREKHGVRIGTHATVVTVPIEITFWWCRWCGNHRKITGEKPWTFPICLCFCPICEQS